MSILQDISITITAEDVLATRGNRQPRPELIHDAEEAIALGQTLWKSAAVYDWFDVRGLSGGQVTLAHPRATNGETVLRIGPKADLLAPATRVLVSVCTIGPALEQRVQQLQAARDVLKSYLLDSAGVVALGVIGEEIRCIAEAAAAELGWGVSPSLSPGSLVGWSLTGQRTLCSLLPLDQIGVRLNAHCVLEPYKSVSAIIGLGPGYDSVHVGSVCKYCALKDTCWRRREEPS
ncbi:MAG: hypothetical protein PVH17_08835 [Anaerolineae bacterium]|jgi:hypothetical protein